MDGNTGGIPNFKNGPYVAPGDLVLGRWGIDRQANVVWAVVNHNNQFAAMPSQLPAAPTDYVSWNALNFTEAERPNDSPSLTSLGCVRSSCSMMSRSPMRP